MEFSKFTKSFFEIPDSVSSFMDFDEIEGDMLFSNFSVFVRRDCDLINSEVEEI